MKIAIMSSPLYHEIAELHGRDRTIWGGAERYMLELCRLLTELGHTVDLYQQCPPKFIPNSPPQMMRVTKVWAGFPVTCLPIQDRVSIRYGTFPMFNMIFNELSERHDLRIYFVTSTTYPMVVHPCISISHGVYWDYSGSDTSAGGEDYRTEYLNRLKESFILADVCVAVDSNVKNVVRAMFPGKETRIRTIRNFVDTSVFKPDESKRRSDGKITVLYPRRFVNIRGCNDFLYCVEKYPQYNYVAVGNANDTEIEGYVKGLKGFEYKYVKPEDMPLVYQEADIALIPTKGAEGLSLSLLESLASGCAVVCTQHGGLMDAVIPGFNAVIYDNQNENCADLINTVAEDAAYRLKLSINARISSAYFDISLWKEEWKQLIKEFE